MAGKVTITNFLNLILVALALAFFWMGIAEPSLTWMLADEILATDIVERGLFDCVSFYYLDTTIHRPVNAAGICLLAALADEFNSPYLGWAVSRVIVYCFLSVSIMLLMNFLFKCDKIKSMVVGMVVISAAMFPISDSNGNLYYLYSLDLSAYGIASACFFISIVFLPNALFSKRAFVGFCVFSLVAMSAMEIFIIINFFLFFFLIVRFQKKVKVPWYSRKNAHKRKIFVFISLTLFSIFTHILPPSFSRKSEAWPKTASILDASKSLLACLDELIFIFSQSPWLLLCLFTIGFFLKLKPRFFELFSGWSLIWSLMISNVIFFTTAAFSIGLTPDFSLIPIRSEDDFFLANHIFDLTDVYHQSGISSRHLLFLSVSLNLLVFVLGVFLSNRFGLSRKVRHLVICVGIIFCLVGLHPDGQGSIRAINDLFFARGDDLNLNHQSTAEPFKPVFASIIPHSEFLMIVADNFFQRKRETNWSSILRSVEVDAYLRLKPTHLYQDVLDHVDVGHRVSRLGSWQNRTMNQYQIQKKNHNFFFYDGPMLENWKTRYQIGKAFEYNDFEATTPTDIGISNLNGLEQLGRKRYCIGLASSENHKKNLMQTRKHFLFEGLNYLVIESLQNTANIQVEVRNDRASVALSWFQEAEKLGNRIGVPNINGQFIVNSANFSERDGKQRLVLIIESFAPQQIEVLWSHENAAEEDENLSSEQRSYPCHIYAGKLNSVKK